MVWWYFLMMYWIKAERDGANNAKLNADNIN